MIIQMLDAMIRVQETEEEKRDKLLAKKAKDQEVTTLHI